jgi:hypothetical protein
MKYIGLEEYDDPSWAIKGGGGEVQAARNITMYRGFHREEQEAQPGKTERKHVTNVVSSDTNFMLLMCAEISNTWSFTSAIATNSARNIFNILILKIIKSGWRFRHHLLLC